VSRGGWGGVRPYPLALQQVDRPVEGRVAVVVEFFVGEDLCADVRWDAPDVVRAAPTGRTLTARWQLTAPAGTRPGR
jgi:hypothetical protein